MATIWRSGSPLERCKDCGAQRQFHGTPHFGCGSFVAETIADYEPGELTAAQLVAEIFDHPNSPRAVACGNELRALVGTVLGVLWCDLAEALA